ncbi:hypothetical protein [uncultured Streptomyces sp.]|uniref:hypothetical protein n=1 Tax=uncultured Streptomyces sp. TaxID=174707 RepID=UPI0026037CFE|nr:hypothetical protein [uncultured Streptomyces sp.]
MEQLAAWGHRLGEASREAVEAVATLLVESALGDGGTRISLHLSDQDGAACIVVLSHTVGLTGSHESGGGDVLHRVTGYRHVTGCGSDTGPEGRRIWAVLDL